MACHTVLAVMAMFVVITNSQLTRSKVNEIALKNRKLPYDVCGDSAVFDQKIINGTAVELGEYPWMAAIGYTTGRNDLSWLCAGSLVTDQYVLTAAHCLDPRRLDKQRPNLRPSVVRLGDLNLDDRKADGASPVDFEVEKTVFHPQYNNDQKTNDIGLIKLKRKVEFDALKKPICLPSPDFFDNTFVGFSSVVAGWGTTQNGRNTILSAATVDIQDTASCRSNITRVLTSSVLDERVICASSPYKDSCQGDSGGPLMMFRRYKDKAQMFLVGVVSYGVGCAVEGYPGVYARVSYYMDWIIDNMEL